MVIFLKLRMLSIKGPQRKQKMFDSLQMRARKTSFWRFPLKET
jgi:hypothetical protein